MLQVAQQISPTTTMTTTTTTASNGVPNGKKTHTSRSLHVVEEIRKRFFTEEWPKNKDLYHENDIEKMRQSEWFIKRFLLLCRRNPDEAFEMLKETLAWRNRVELHTAQPNFFPREFYQIGGLFAYESDREGNPVIYLRIRMHRKIKELAEPIQQFLFYTIFRVDQETDSKGAVIVFDCSGAGYSNMDIDMLRTFSEVSYKYFPYCFKYVIVYELHWMLNAFRRVAMSVIPGAFVSLIRFANKDDITNYIAPDKLPDFMGGTCRTNYRIVPEGCKTVETLGKERGFTEEDVKRIRPMFEPFLSEGIAEIEKREQEDRAEEEESKRRAQQQHSPKLTTAASKVLNSAKEEAEVNDVLGSFDDSASSSSSIAVIRACSRPFAQYASIYPPNNVLFRRITSEDSRWPQFVRKTTNNSASQQQQLLVGLVMIRNNHRTTPLAFKIQSTNSDRYLVTPNQGILLSGAFVSIQITVRSAISPQSHSISMDKFLVLMLPEDQLLQNTGQDSEQFNNLFVKHMDKVYSHKLRVQMPVSGQTTTTLNSTTMIDNDDSPASSSELDQLKSELKQMKVKYRMLESSQRWTNLALFILTVSIILALLAAVFFTDNNDNNNLCSNGPISSDHLHKSFNLLKNNHNNNNPSFSSPISLPNQEL